MSLNQTPGAQRVHIGLFGLRNAGKSSLMNALTGQMAAIVSDTPGTTTDPVQKAMELLPLGPVVFVDTPGFDDTGELGQLRVKRASTALARVDIALLVVDSRRGLTPLDVQWLDEMRALHIAHLVVMNKCEHNTCARDAEKSYVSCVTQEGIQALKERIAHLVPDAPQTPLLSDLVTKGDTVVLVIPIDESAPKGRLILPQQMAIRELLDAGALPLVCRDIELPRALAITTPHLVITDSQVLETVSHLVPASIRLTSFSILMARHKGFLQPALRAVQAVDSLRATDKVLIAEGCTHHRQCNDIGSVKIPRWLSAHLGFRVDFDLTSGADFPDDLSPYKLVIHCGGCMLTPRQMQQRMKIALAQEVPFVNYGLLIAHLNGVLQRSIEIFQKDNK